MAVLVGTRTGFELLGEADVEQVVLGRGLRPGPRVLRRFEVGDTRRPASRRRSVPVHGTAMPAACRVRPERHGAWQLLGIGVFAAVVVICLRLLHLGVSDTASVPGRTGVVYVQVGESLSDVAERSAPGSDTDAVVDRIRELNRMADPAVVPGRPLIAPVGTVDVAP